MGIEKEKADFESWATDKFPIAGLGQFEKHNNGTYLHRSIRNMYEAWQAAKAQAVLEGFVIVSQKDLLELTIAINAVDLATHTESKTNEVREMWQQVALKLMALCTAQEQKG